MPGKSEIADRIAARGWSRAASSSAVDAVLDEITAALAAGERVTLTGFGTFEAAPRAARTARNPRTGVSIDVPASTVARFHPGTALRARVAAGVAVPATALGAAPVGALAPAQVAPPAAKAPAKASAPEKPVPSKDAKTSGAKAKAVKAAPKKSSSKKADANKADANKADAKKAETSAKARAAAKKKTKADGKSGSKHSKKKK